MLRCMAEMEPGHRLRITTTAELLKAVELGIVDKTEARSLLGFGVKRGRLARVQPRTGGKFARGEQVLADDPNIKDRIGKVVAKFWIW